MSLGWQSESALLPSKATPINVDSKSMMSMKALVYNIEQKLSSKAAGLDARSHSRKNPRHACSGVEKTTTKESLSSHTKNPSMKKQSRADTQEDDDTNIKVAASLRAKAALYDQIAVGKGGGQQHQNSQLQNSIASSGSGAFLINFDEKRKADVNSDTSDYNNWKVPRYEPHDKRNPVSLEPFDVTSGSSSSSSSSSSSCRYPEKYMNDRNEEVIDIIDSFGRSKTIAINSREYEAYEENIEIGKAKRKLHEKNGQQNGNNFHKNLEFDPSSDNKPDKFSWSNGHTHSESGEWLKDLVTERGLKALVEQKVEREVELSIGAKVKTMYEKTLSSSAKTYLKEVHDESVMQRTLHQEKASVTSSRLDDRREMLRLKKLQQQNK